MLRQSSEKDKIVTPRQTILGLTCALLSSSAVAQSVTITAPDAPDDVMDVLRSSSLTLSASTDGTTDPQSYVAAARADYRALLTALYSEGYYAGEIDIRLDGAQAAGIAPLAAPNAINAITITVTTGPRFTFGTAAVTPTTSATVLPEAFATGMPAKSQVIRTAVIAAVEAWRDEGHAKAEASGQQITARHDTQTLDTTVTLAPGPQLTFGTLTINGNNLVRTSAVRRIAGVPEGRTFAPDDLDAAAARLRKTGAFDSVALIEADEIGPNNTLPIALEVSEAKLRRLGAGIELSTIEGLRGSLYWLHRNALGGAERFQIEGEIAGIGGDTGGIDYALTTSLGIPAVFTTRTDFLATATISREDEPDYLVDKVTIETALTRSIGSDKSTSAGIGYQAAREVTDLGTREYTILTLPLNGTLERRDDVTNPKGGYYLSLDATPFLGLRGSANGGRIFADARGYTSFGEDNRVTLAARSQIGSVLGAQSTQVPADFLFYSGGGGTVRGQEYKSLAVTNGTSTTGGLSFVGAQLEARVDVNDTIGVVGFMDYGYVGASSDLLTDGDWHSGAGLGLRYNTGIGPIRVDVATPTSGDDAFDNVQLYIGIGQSF